MKRILTCLLTVLFVFVTVLQPLTASEPQVFIRGIRPLGMGGAFVAISDDENAIFYNPSGITQRQGALFTLFQIPINITDDVLKFMDFYNSNSDNLKNFDSLSIPNKIDLLNKINNTVTTYSPIVRLGSPVPTFNWISGPGNVSWGMGLFNQASLGFKFNRSLIVPSLSLFGDVDAIAAVPIAHRFDSLPLGLPGCISAGVTLKAIYRGQINENDLSVLQFDNFNPQLQTGRGFGLDAGTLYQPSQRWNLGLQITDLGGTNIAYDAVSASDKGQVDKPAYNSMINSQWNIGAAYIPSKIYYWPGKYINTRDRLIFAADVRDILNPATPLFDSTIWAKLHLGAELRWGPLSLRGGYSSGYPAFGFGLRVPYLGARFDYAYWGDELGVYAGQEPQWNQQITLAWSWGDQKGRAYGNDAKKKDAASARKTLIIQPASAVPAKATNMTPPAANSAILVNGSESTTTKGVQPGTAVPSASATSVAPSPAAVKPPPAAVPAVAAPMQTAPGMVSPSVQTPAPVAAPANTTPNTQNNN